MTVRYFRIQTINNEFVWAVCDTDTCSLRSYWDPGWDQCATCETRATPTEADLIDAVRNFHLVADLAATALAPGYYHPRIWRAPTSPPLHLIYRREFTSTVQATKRLMQQMREVFGHVEPVPANLRAFGHEMRHVLILASTEVEAAWRAILLANQHQNQPPASSQRWTTNEYVRLLQPLALDGWELALTWYPDLPVRKPFGGWSAGQPTRSLQWYSDYNAVKHDRENSFGSATLNSMIDAVAGAFVMLIAQFGPEGIQGEDGLSDFTIKSTPQWPLVEHYLPPWLDPERRVEIYEQQKKKVFRGPGAWVPPWKPSPCPGL